MSVMLIMPHIMKSVSLDPMIRALLDGGGDIQWRGIRVRPPLPRCIPGSVTGFPARQHQCRQTDSSGSICSAAAAARERWRYLLGWWPAQKLWCAAGRT